MHAYDGYLPVAVDVTGFWRPLLCDCPTTHYRLAAGKALPAIPVGLIARVGSDGAFTTCWACQPDYGEDGLVIWKRSTQDKGAYLMSTEENKLVGRRFFGEILNNGNLQRRYL